MAMPTYYTKSRLQTYAAANQHKYKVRENILRKSASTARATIFLSHSHADLEQLDKATLDAIKILLADVDVDVYIDAFDPNMPSITSAATAEILKERIRSCDKLVVVATNNAVNSRWVPWELGYGDGEHGVERCAILPIADASGVWKGSEYMQLYRHILPTDSGPGIFSPEGKNGRFVKAWVSS